MGQRFDTISFLSDLGIVDEQVGIVKAIVRDMAPHAVVVDLTHQVPRYDVRAGSLALARAIGYVPGGVVMAVVDAGERRAVGVEVAEGAGVLIGPDNGLLASAAAMAGGAGRTVVFDRPEFHLASPGGVLPIRDVYAPIAAHLCNGTDLAKMGEVVDAESLLPGVVPLARQFGDDGQGTGDSESLAAEGVNAEVLWVDHFGNCQLNIGPDDVAPWGSGLGVRLHLTVGEDSRTVQRVAKVSELGPGAVGLILDGSGLLTLVLDHRSAADELGLVAADQLTLNPLGDDGGARGVSVPVTMRQ